MAKLTDNQLAQLYLGLSKDFKELHAKGYDVNTIYNHLYSRLQYTFTDRHSAFYGFDLENQQAAFGVLNTFFSACPTYRKLPDLEKKDFFQKPVQIIVIQNYEHHYCSGPDPFFNWLMLSSFMAHSHHGGGVYGGSHHHGHGSNSNSEGLAYLVLIVLALLAAVATLIALYYLFSQFLNSMERFVYNEGWLQATITVASMLGGAAAGGLFGTFVASFPLIALAIAAGISNPIGIAIGGIVCLTIIGAAISCGLTKLIQNKIIENKNKDALDPQDPYRFALTDKEAEHLRDLNIDPIRVKCAIVAIREQMGEKRVSSLLNRLFVNSEQQALLKLVRQLRRGDLTQVTVGEMNFDLNFPLPWYYNPTPVYQPASQPAAYNPQFHSPSYNPSTQPTTHYHPNTEPLYPDLAAYAP